MEFGPGVLSSVGVAGADVLPPAGVAAGAGVGLSSVGGCGVAAGSIGGMGDWPTAEASTSGIGGALGPFGLTTFLLYQGPCGFDQVPKLPHLVIGAMGAVVGFTLLNPENVGETALLVAVCGPNVTLLGPTSFGLLGSYIIARS